MTREIGKIYIPNMFPGLNKTLRNEFYCQSPHCDVVFCCDDTIHRAHRIVLQHYIPRLEEVWHLQKVRDTDQILETICVRAPVDHVFWFFYLLYNGLVGVKLEDHYRIAGILGLLRLFNIPVTSRRYRIRLNAPMQYLLAGPISQFTPPREPYDAKTGEALTRFKEDLPPVRLRAHLMGTSGNPMGSHNSILFTVLEEMVLATPTRQPPNCFIIFSMTVKTDIALFYHFETAQNLTRLVAKIWNHLEDSYKAPFIEAAAYAKEFHKNNFPLFYRRRSARRALKKTVRRPRVR